MKSTNNENFYQSATLTKSGTAKEEIVKKSIFNEIFLSIKSGIFAFAIVFSFSIISKSLAYSLGTTKVFSININDVIFSFWAFLIFSFITFLHNFLLYKKK